MKRIFLTMLLVAAAVALVSPITAFAAEPAVSYAVPKLQVDIPGVDFELPTLSGGLVSVNFLGAYVAGVYRYLIGFALTVAIVMIMVGGLQYVLGASSGDVKSGKKRITDAIEGFVLLMFVYVILYTVNPETTLFRALDLTQIDPETFIVDNFDTGGDAVTTDIGDIPGILCPKSTASNTLEEIAKSFIGNVAYRFGGKGGAAPFTSEKKSKVDSSGRWYGEYCPEGNLCFDCSGFANIVRACAGQKTYAVATATMSGASEKIESCTSTSVNGKDLVPGDFVGWNGHVGIYIGNGLILDSHGGGREPGMGVGPAYAVNSFFCGKLTKRDYFVSRVSP